MQRHHTASTGLHEKRGFRSDVPRRKLHRITASRHRTSSPICKQLKVYRKQPRYFHSGKAASSPDLQYQICRSSRIFSGLLQDVHFARKLVSVDGKDEFHLLRISNQKLQQTSSNYVQVAFKRASVG
jgi:hypothetical protein